MPSWYKTTLEEQE